MIYSDNTTCQKTIPIQWDTLSLIAQGSEPMQEHVSARTVAGSASNVTPIKPAQTDFDVVIVGAGLSGIGAAFHLQRDCPKKSFVILEGRDALGGRRGLVPSSSAALS